MNRKLIIYILVLFYCSICCWSQKINNTHILDSIRLESHRNIEVPDSLKNITYKKLFKVMYNDTSSVKTFELYAKGYLQRAKRDSSKIKLVHAYRHLSYLGYLEDSKLRIIYLDSIINYTKNLNIKKYPEYAHYLKGLVFYNYKDIKNSLDSYLKAFHLAKEKNELKLMYNSMHGIAVLKSRIGNYDEALQILRKCQGYLETKDYEEQDDGDYLATLSVLTHLYRKNSKIDSSSLVNSLGIKKSLSNQSKEFYGYFILSEGMNLYEQKEYNKSIDSLKKSLKLLQEVDDKPNIAFANFYLGKNYFDTGQIKKSIANFKKVDTLFQIMKDLNPDLRENYEILINYYKDNGDKDNQLLYINQLIKADSIFFNNYKYLSENINKGYDTPELIREKEELLDDIDNKKNWLFYISTILFFITILTIVFLFFNYRRQKTYRQRLEELLNKNTNEQKDIVLNHDIEKRIEVPQKISEDILSGLLKFEKNQGYLQKDITVTSLAKELNTNTKYLSKVINFYHQKSFVNYVNDARIDFIIEELKQNKKIQAYTIKAISEKAGFKNSQSFSQSFLKRTGIYPSYFIKKLKI